MSLTAKGRKTFYKFGIASIALLLAVVVTLLIPALDSGGMYFLFLTAIIFSTLYGDTRTGVFAATLSIIINFFLLDYLGKSPQNIGQWLVLLAFGLAAGFTIFICHAQAKSEAARLLAESRYRMIFEDAITGIYETTVDGRYSAANPKLAQMFGYESPAQLIDQAANLNDKFYVSNGRRKEFIRLLETQGSVTEFESEIYRRDGQTVWITENSVPVRDRNGELIGFQGTTIEITDRKLAEAALQKAHEELEEKVVARTFELENANKILRDEIIERMRVENALRESEEKFRALVEVSSEMIWEVNEETNYTYVSPKSKEFHGYEPHEMLGKKPFFLMLPEEAKRVAKIFKQIGQSRETFYFLETITVHKDGETSISETSGVPFFDDAGNFRGYRGVARNITERKRAETALLDSQLHLRSVVTAAPVILFALDSAGIFTLSEGKGLAFLGLKPGQVVGQSVFELYADVPKLIADVKRALRGESFTNTVEIADLCYESRYTPIFENGGKVSGLIGVSIDITERKRIENELLASQKQLRNLSAHLQSVREEERKNIARELHDELGQSLTALKIDLVRFAEKSGSAKKGLTPAEIKSKVPQMLTIVDGAMDTTRKIVAELRPGILDELGLAATMEWQTGEFQKRTGIKCSLEIEFDEHAACINLKTTVFRILQECLTNIARHSGASEAQITLRDEGHRIFFEVSDNGRGIESAQAASASGRSFGILGMRERALLLNGAVELSRVETGGTRVTVVIPRPQESTKSDD